MKPSQIQREPRKRANVSPTVQAEILARTRRRCCICFALNDDSKEKEGQLAHLDRDPSNPSIDNLAFLCLDHHSKYDSISSQSKGYTIAEVRLYRKELYKFLGTFNKSIVISIEMFSEKPDEDVLKLINGLKQHNDIYLNVTTTGSIIAFLSLGGSAPDRNPIQDWAKNLDIANAYEYSPEQSQSLTQLANESLSNDPKAAAAAFTRALCYDPDNAQAWASLSRAYRDQARLVGIDEHNQLMTIAERCAFQALETAPQDPEVWVNLAVVRADREMFDEAIYYTNKAIEIAPLHEYALYTKSVIYIYKGLYSESHAILTELSARSLPSELELRVSSALREIAAISKDKRK